MRIGADAKRVIVRNVAALRHKFECGRCHDAGYVYCKVSDLPEGGDINANPLPGLKGIRFPEGMAYYSLYTRGLVTLHCPCRVVEDSKCSNRKQAYFSDIGVHEDLVFSYLAKWEDEVGEA